MGSFKAPMLEPRGKPRLPEFKAIRYKTLMLENHVQRIDRWNGFAVTLPASWRTIAEPPRLLALGSDDGSVAVGPRATRGEEVAVFKMGLV